MKVPKEFWPENDFKDDLLESALVFVVCLCVAGITALLAGLVWGWLA